MTGVVDLVKEKRDKAMLHDDMTLAILMVYVQSIEESKFCRIDINLKRRVLVTKVNLGSRGGLKLKMNQVLLC